jgi:hypothetical protein
MGGWGVDWFQVEIWGKPSSGWRRWLCSFGGIIDVVFGLKNGGRQMLESSGRRPHDLKHREKCEGRDARVSEQ